MKRIPINPFHLARPIAISALALLPIHSATDLRAETALGQVAFPTTCNGDANAAFQNGLTLLHHMMYVQAEAVFNQAIAQDDNCAMLQWGVAMSNFHPLWPGQPSQGETERGTAAAAMLSSATNLSPVETGLVNAALKFYDSDNGGYRESITAWADAQSAAFEASPDDLDTAAFFALSQLATAPRGDATMARQDAVGDLLDTLHQTNPDHPGVIHYAIHAYDNPPLADRGLHYAEIYDSIAPSVPHALHMPSHIFVRLGKWDETVAWNIRSAEAAMQQSHGEVVSAHFAHAIDYRIYAHLQRGEFDVAEAVLADFLSIPNHQPNFGSAYALAAAPTRTLLEAERWADAANLSDDMHPAIPWERFPQTVAMRVFARGIGAIRSGDSDKAGRALVKLGELRDGMLATKQDYWASLTEAQMLSIEAWRELAQGNTELAIQLQTKAAEIEDAAGKSPVTPSHVLPARELLGDMFTELGDEARARQAYYATLAHSPNRRRSRLAVEG